MSLVSDERVEELLEIEAQAEKMRVEIERLRASYKRLHDAAHEIYWSANWTSDREVDHDAMWDELSDALEQSDRRAALDAPTEHDQKLNLYEQRVLCDRCDIRTKPPVCLVPGCPIDRTC